MPRLTYSLRPCSKGSSMFRPTDSPPPSRAPLLAASMVPGPPPVMMAKPRRASSAASAADRPQTKEGDGCTGGAQRIEPRHELGLDPQHPPGVAFEEFRSPLGPL